MKTFKGILRVNANQATLESGGIIVNLQGDLQQFKPFNGSLITVTGEQSGDIIKNAVLAPQPESMSMESNRNKLLEVISVIKASETILRASDSVIGVRPGYSNKAGAIPEMVIVVVFNSSKGEPENIPSNLQGIKVEKRKATPMEIVTGIMPLSTWEGMIEEAGSTINYEPPPKDLVELKEMEVENITCHVGPDAGWKTLKPFLEGTTQSLTVAMYEFYADYIIDTVAELGEQTDATLDMILQVNPNEDNTIKKLHKSWGERFTLVPASLTGPNKIFKNSYHTKVAVRDSSAFWLSSGNWSPTSQPWIPEGSTGYYSKGNREWHVIIEDEKLAKMYEKFIKYDMDESDKANHMEVPESEEQPFVFPDLLIPESAFMAEAAIAYEPFEPRQFATDGKPVKVKPLMSPDNYADEVLKLIRSAKASLYLQFSYVNEPIEKLKKIVEVIAEKMEEGLDVKVIVGPNQKSENTDLLLGTYGWKSNMFRLQKSKLHNKGILIDGKIAGVGSNNWSNDGISYNRDTTLIFYSRPIAQYYTEVFLWDWENRTKSAVGEPETVPELAPESGPTPLGMVRIPWKAWYND